MSPDTAARPRDDTIDAVASFREILAGLDVSAPARPQSPSTTRRAGSFVREILCAPPTTVPRHQVFSSGDLAGLAGCRKNGAGDGVLARKPWSPISRRATGRKVGSNMVSDRRPKSRSVPHMAFCAYLSSKYDHKYTQNVRCYTE